MSDYTPTTAEVRGAYVVHGFRDCHRSAVETEHQSMGGFSAEFDRWLTQHDADTREQCAREIEEEAQNYAGDASRDFATIYARLIREGGRK